jgi:c-di-AMP phosphodiesterase-like protein
MKKLLETPINFSKEEEKVIKLLNTFKEVDNIKERANQMRRVSELACPNHFNNFLACYNKNSNVYQKCMKETKSLIFCTGNFFSKLTAFEVYNKIKEEN